MKLSKFLNMKAPFSLYDERGNEVYRENRSGYWHKKEYDEHENEVYWETSSGYCIKREFDDKGNETYWEDSEGDWCKKEYDDKGNEVYFENSIGEIINNRPKHTIILDGKEIKISEESYQKFIKQFKGEK